MNLSAQVVTKYESPKDIYIKTKIVDQSRKVRIYIPKEYTNSRVSYPVIYILDGQRSELEAFVLASSNFMMNFNTMPPSILVFVPQLHRGYELNPPIIGKKSNEIGGADDFIDFLKSTMTYISKNYRVAPFRTIIGHSLGGSLATYGLTKYPDLFSAYLIISPNFNFFEGFYVKAVKKSYKRQYRLA
ncbi:hypothetical protein LJ707_09120 [Mucilaginibacter sp. UR6-1]|uniref:alpha/beta hydrolase n=1 Tax=Mucilaginibacter sp. UR6-1 TaxID=1435643 RepID=UPI001E397C5F|nr:alpha/beta hydrolase-fold protein [Mucilaginibacter sp. UR6-1]MCC8409090.1 hypothetical protein [Mucilaginibacter sp. UR6-1]